jgi:hypothetical protein
MGEHLGAKKKIYAPSLLPIKLVVFNSRPGVRIPPPSRRNPMEKFMTSNTGNHSRGASAPPPADLLQPVREALSGLRFGAIQLTVHEGKLVQMDVTERQRFTA